MQASSRQPQAGPHQDFVLPAWEAELLTACERLLEFAPARMRTPTREQGEQLFPVVALFFAATNTYEASLLLCRHGRGEQALMLNRALFEAMVDAHWAHANPKDAVARYSDHARFTNALHTELTEPYLDLLDASPVPSAELSPEERRRLVDLYGPHGHRSWTGLGLHGRVEAIRHAWGQERDQRLLQLFRDLAGKLNNEALHPSAAGMFRQVVPAQEPSEGPTVNFRSGPSLHMFRQALLGAVWSYAQILGLIYEEFLLAERDAMGQAYEHALRLLYEPSDAETRRTSRNDLCPCGSGRKYKRCHLGRELHAKRRPARPRPFP